MSRALDGTDDNLDFQNSTPVTNVSAFSYSVWAYQNNITQDHGLFDFGAADGGIQMYADDIGSISGRTDCFKTVVDEVGGADLAQLETASNSMKQNQWQHVFMGALQASLTGLQIWIDGAEDANSPISTSLLANLGNSATTIRMGESQAGARDRNGNLAEVGFWNRVLDDPEIIALSKGYSPLFFPRGLVFYADLIGRLTTEIDIINKKTATMNGSLAAFPHPRIIYPS